MSLFARIHQTLCVTPAMEAGVSDKLYASEWIVSLIKARDSKPNRAKTHMMRISI